MKKIVYLVLIMMIHSFGYSQNMDWKSLIKEVNGPVSWLTVYNEKLVVGGDFTKGGNVSVSGIASWNGSDWDSLGSGISGKYPFVTQTMVHNNKLYVVGNFDTAGTTPAKNIAVWNDTSWANIGIGANATIYSIAVFNNEIYVGGLFDSIGGIAANRIAKWDGIKWDSLESGIQGSNINDLCVFKNELYVLGAFDSAGNIPCNTIARWDGHYWNNVSVGVYYSNSAMTEWDNNLLVGSQNLNSSQLIQQWDGTNWSQFSNQPKINASVFSVINDQLYCAVGMGAAGPRTSTSVFLWNSLDNSWNPLGTGINNTTTTLCSYKGELYCGGSFSKRNNSPHNFIARYIDVTGVKNQPQNVFSITVFPIPASSIFSVAVKSPSDQHPLQFSIYDILGKQVFTTELLNSVTTINNFEAKGIFSWKLEDAQHHIQTGKLITQ